MRVNDIIGSTLDDARRTLESMGLDIHAIRVTAPPREFTSQYDDTYRVIRFEIVKENSIELLVCKPL